MYEIFKNLLVYCHLFGSRLTHICTRNVIRTKLYAHATTEKKNNKHQMTRDFLWKKN